MKYEAARFLIENMPASFGADGADLQRLHPVYAKHHAISSGAMILNIIGKNYQGLGKYKEAEDWFIRSTHRLPNRIYPYYLLVKLYAEHSDVFPKVKLEQAARMVMEKEPKVELTAIREMREEVKRIKKEFLGMDMEG